MQSNYKAGFSGILYEPYRANILIPANKAKMEQNKYLSIILQGNNLSFWILRFAIISAQNKPFWSKISFLTQAIFSYRIFTINNYFLAKFVIPDYNDEIKWDQDNIDFESQEFSKPRQDF